MRQALARGLARVAVLGAGFAAGAALLAAPLLPGFVRAAGMLALPIALYFVLRGEDRRLRRAADNIRAGSLGPPFRNLLLGKRRQLDKALHR